MSLARPRQVRVTALRLFRLMSYLAAGWRVWRGPDKLFDSEYYLTGNPDVRSARMPPLLHFLLFGAFEGRQPSPFFDPKFYLLKYPDIAATHANPLLHYLKRGAAEGRKPHPLFSGDSLAEFLDACRRPAESVHYSWWMRQEEQLPPPVLTLRPRFSVILAVSGPRRDWLREAIASVYSQSYADWEVCICQNTGGEILSGDTLATHDSRIHVTAAAGDIAVSAALDRAAAKRIGWRATHSHGLPPGRPPT